MLYRNCAGGVVFSEDKVLLLKNEKGEWIMPKGLVEEGASRREVARERVMHEAGVDGRVVDTAGVTEYEFYSATRKKSVCNRVTWYIMETKDNVCTPNRREDFVDGGFFERDDALTRVTYTQDRALLADAYLKWQELNDKV